jgi:hypothetical protein
MPDNEENEMYRKFLEFQKSQNNKNDDEETPLTKPKRKIKEIIEEVKPIEKEIIKTDTTIVKKQKSEKQLEQFKIAQQKRKENIDKKKQEKKIEASRILLEHDKKVNIKPIPKEVEQEQEQESSDNETEQEVVIKRKNPKKKKKKIIKVIVSDSESDYESGESIKAKKYPSPIQTREMVSQRNKKSVIKTHLPNNSNNFFCD